MYAWTATVDGSRAHTAGARAATATSQPRLVSMIPTNKQFFFCRSFIDNTLITLHLTPHCPHSMSTILPMVSVQTAATQFTSSNTSPLFSCPNAPHSHCIALHATGFFLSDCTNIMCTQLPLSRATHVFSTSHLPARTSLLKSSD